MPQDNIRKYMLIVVLATIISGCATVPSTSRQDEAEQAISNQTPIREALTMLDMTTSVN